MTRTHYTLEIHAIASQHELDPLLVEAVVICESSGDPHARRLEPNFWKRYMDGKAEWDGEHFLRWGASLGLMQIMPTTAIEYGYDKELGPELLFQPLLNLEYGCKILRALITWAGGNVQAALAAYNGGKGGFRKEQPQRYAAVVLRKWDQLRREA